jgi:hypothetical protein
LSHALPIGLANESLEIGIFSETARWKFDTTGDGTFDVNQDDVRIDFGRPTDVPLTGDWDGDGDTELAVWRSRPAGPRFLLDSNDDGVLGQTDATVTLGQNGDRPVVGDWNGDGLTDFGVRRQNQFILWHNMGNAADPNPVATFGFKNFNATDQPVAGDWNGDGQDDVGVFRRGRRYFLDTNGNRDWEGTAVDAVIGGWGDGSHWPVIADWNEDGTDDLGSFGDGMFRFDRDGDRAPDVEFPFGTATDRPVVRIAEGPCVAKNTLRAHIHVQLDIEVNGQPVVIPEGVGIAGECPGPVHTHDATGRLHGEDSVQRPFHLGEFFEAWGMPFDPTRLGTFVADAEHTLTLLVNGQPNIEFGDYTLRNGDTILVQYQAIS